MTRTIRGVQKDTKVAGGIFLFRILKYIDGWRISDAIRKDSQADNQECRCPVSVSAVSYFLGTTTRSLAVNSSSLLSPRHLNATCSLPARPPLRNVHIFKL